MKALFVTISVFAVSATMAFAQAPKASAAKKQPNVEFEMMTWPEVKKAIAEGKTTALFYTGAPSSADRRTSTAATR